LAELSQGAKAIAMQHRYQYEDALFAEKRRRQGHKAISKYPAKVFSQNFEDAMIAEIFHRVGTASRTFVEVGIGDGTECNTRFLLAQGWKGLWIEGDTGSAERAKTKFHHEISAGLLCIVQSFVTRDNINSILERAGYAEEIDFLSVDIDMNTHHIWRSIKTRARVSCIEYNATFPPTVDFCVPYADDGTWDGTNWFGASLQHLTNIARDKSLSLVGCDSTGINAFFVADSLIADSFIAPNNIAAHYEPARYVLTAQRGHPRAA